jgi:hypothetical protein
MLGDRSGAPDPREHGSDPTAAASEPPSYLPSRGADRSRPPVEAMRAAPTLLNLPLAAYFPASSFSLDFWTLEIRSCRPFDPPMTARAVTNRSTGASTFATPMLASTP